MNKAGHYPFDDPIPLPGGGELRSLRDAGNFIANFQSASTMRLHGRQQCKPCCGSSSMAGAQCCRALEANCWIKWLPIICFFCTLFGFVLGWCWGTIGACGSWHAAQKLEIIPKAVGDRGNKIMP